MSSIQGKFTEFTSASLASIKWSSSFDNLNPAWYEREKTIHDIAITCLFICGLALCMTATSVFAFTILSTKASGIAAFFFLILGKACQSKSQFWNDPAYCMRKREEHALNMLNTRQFDATRVKTSFELTLLDKDDIAILKQKSDLRTMTYEEFMKCHLPQRTLGYDCSSHASVLKLDQEERKIFFQKMDVFRAKEFETLSYSSFKEKYTDKLKYAEGSLSFKDTDYVFSKELVEKRYLSDLNSYHKTVQGFIKMLQEVDLLKISCKTDNEKNNYISFLKGVDAKYFLILVGKGDDLATLLTKDEDKTELNQKFLDALFIEIERLSYDGFKMTFGLNCVDNSTSKLFKITPGTKAYELLKKKCLDAYISHDGLESGAKHLVDTCKKYFGMTDEDVLPYQALRYATHNGEFRNFRETFLTDKLCKDNSFKHLSLIDTTLKNGKLKNNCLRYMKFEECSLKELEEQYKNDIAYFNLSKEEYAIHCTAKNVRKDKVTYQKFRESYLDSKPFNGDKKADLNNGVTYIDLKNKCLEHIKNDKGILEELIITYKNDMICWDISEEEIEANNFEMAYRTKAVLNGKMSYQEFREKYLTPKMFTEESQKQLDLIDETSKEGLKKICLNAMFKEKIKTEKITTKYNNDIAFFKISDEEYKTQCGINDLLASRIEYWSFSSDHLKSLIKNDGWLDKDLKQQLKAKCIDYIRKEISTRLMSNPLETCMNESQNDMDYFGIVKEDLTKK